MFYFIARKFRYMHMYELVGQVNVYAFVCCSDMHMCMYIFPHRGDQLHMSYQLLYYIMTLLKSCTEKAFELVIDLTQVTQLNEPDVSRVFMCYVQCLVYMY